jgi:hypothetical protein
VSYARLPDIQQRYGTANEPHPDLGSVKTASTPNPSPPEGKSDTQTGEQSKIGGNEKSASAQASAVTSKAQPATVEGLSALQPLSARAAETTVTSQDSTISAASKPSEQVTDSILQQIGDVGPSKEERGGKDGSSSSHVDDFVATAPHMAPPPFVHQFDTYGLVRRLEDSGWSKLHAITTMKAVRLMLAENTEFARDALVSKSQVENETYLFRAACAELKTEVTARRRSEQEKMRAQRSQLQHELDILTQRLGQESAALKDEVKGMFDDRKMTVRNEQREMESKVQRLNYKITVDLQADARSEVEGLRWVMTRRVIIALSVVVVMVLGSLKLYSNKAHDQEMDAKRKANMKSNGSQTEGNNFSDGPRDYRSSGGDGEVMVKEGDNPAFVSLG